MCGFPFFFFQVYAPTSLTEEEEIDQFNGKLQDVMDSVPKGDILVVMEDFNAQIRDIGETGIANFKM